MSNSNNNKILGAVSGGSQFQNVIFGDEAHAKLLEGATILAKAVGSTMGPSGHTVIIDSSTGSPVITKDGVTVARSINLKNNLHSMGAELLKEVASKTNEIAGDGTSTATILAYTMLREGIKMIATGRDAIYVKKGMDIAIEKVLDILAKNSVQVRNKQDIINVGTISANGDKKIGELLSNAIDKVGQDGIITIEPGRSTQTTLEVVEGMQFDGGFLSPYFITNSEKNTAELSEPFILLTSKKISSLADLIPIMEKVANTNRPLFVVAEDVEGEALHTLIVNKFKGTLASCAVKAPSYGDNRTDILGDLAAITGGTVIDSSSSIMLKNMQLEHLGIAKKVVVSRTNTTIVGESDDEIKIKVQERVQGLRNALQSEASLDSLHVDRYRKRLAKLAGGIAVIRVGGATEVEILEKKDRVEDALNATMAAAQEGIVAGGGSALFFAQAEVQSHLLSSYKKIHKYTDDEQSGFQVVLTACRSPLQTIVSNTGKSPDVVMDKLLRHMSDGKEKVSNAKEGNDFDTLSGIVSPLRFGYDASKTEYCDMVDAGIVDAVKVTRAALSNAASVVGLILCCNAVVLNEQEEE